jgi:hypothetical protein
MSRFSRKWTIDLNISSESFLDSFHRVIQDDNAVVLEKPFVLANKQYKDFFGAIQQHSFRIWKRTGLLDIKGVPELYGKIIDNGSTTHLELRMVNNFRFNYFSIIFLDIIISFLLLLVLSGIVRIDLVVTGTAEAAYLIIIGLVMFGVAHFIQLKLIDRHLNNLKKLYNQTLLTIEASSKTKSYSG